MIGIIADAVGGVAKQWLGNKQAKATAAAELAVAELKARASVAERKANYEVESSKQTYSLDALAVKQANRSWFDEFLSLILLAPGILTAVGACIGAAPELWGLAIFEAIDKAPLWYQVAVGLIMVHYFGFRSLLRLYLNGKFKLRPAQQENGNGKETTDQA